MAENVPMQVIVAAFQDEEAAGEALKTLKAAKRERLIGIQDAAVIRKDEDGKLHIKETGDMKPGKGAGIGALIGGAVGLLAGPIVLAAGAGALIGGLAASGDSGFRDERLERLGDSLEPGTSAIVAVVEHKWVEQVRNELQEVGADALTEALADDIAEQLSEGHDVVSTAVVTDEGVAAGRAAGDDESVEVTGAVATGEGVVAGTAEAEAGGESSSTSEAETKGD